MYVLWSLSITVFAFRRKKKKSNPSIKRLYEEDERITLQSAEKDKNGASIRIKAFYAM
jgi:cbb3-type cytochrome oxidase subunit 3